MTLVAHAVVIALQCAVCVLTAVGWGYWICRLGGANAPRTLDAPSTQPAYPEDPLHPDASKLLCVVAGWCVGLIVLQDLLPAGLRLQWSAPLAAAAAFVGLLGWRQDWRATRTPLASSSIPPPTPRLPPTVPSEGTSASAGYCEQRDHTSAAAAGSPNQPFSPRLLPNATTKGASAPAGCFRWWHRRFTSSVSGGALLLFAAVFAFQSAGLIYSGARDYYGYARQDQVNYVQLAQFLVEKPFATARADIGLHPWLVKGVDTKNQRIGQSVANGYLAAITGSDASATYGTVSIFFVALAAVSVFGCLLAFGVRRDLAWLGGAWTGVLPGLTQTHLDGFFSQTSTLFCFVGLAWALRLAARQPRLGAVAAAALLAFLLSAYSEEFILGLALALALIAALPSANLARKAGLAAVCILAPWASLAPFAGGLWRFIRGQYQAARHADALAVWQPHAGTWRGWNESFLAAPNHHAALLAAAAGMGVVLLGLAIVGAAAPGAGHRAQRAVLAIFGCGVLAALVIASRPAFPTYPFGKLLITFSPLAVILIVFACALPPPMRLRTEAWLLPLLVLLAGWASWTKLSVVFANGAGLPTMNSPEARAVYRELDAHPERTYLIVEPHGMLNCWLAYHARHALAYSAVPIGDSEMGGLAFMHSPPPGTEVWEVSGGAVKRREVERVVPNALATPTPDRR